MSVTKNAVDRITFVKGFADALISIGWLTVDDSTLKFPNFERHNGNSSKKRVLTNQRVTKSRKMKRTTQEECNAESVTPAFQKALPEIEREIDKERDLPPTPHRGRRASTRLDPLTVELPDWLPAPLWAEWVGFRQQLGKPIKTKQGIAESLKNLAKFRKQGHLPETVIRQSIANEWQGLFEPKSAPRQAGMTPLETSYTGIPPGFQGSYEP
ncbi:hypothetical protein BK025_09165 [Sodalis sp. TME1]|nr:hypothetical protein BK025_09165 [Sodalis sp. TME1]